MKNNISHVDFAVYCFVYFVHFAHNPREREKRKKAIYSFDLIKFSCLSKEKKEKLSPLCLPLSLSLSLKMQETSAAVHNYSL